MATKAIVMAVAAPLSCGLRNAPMSSIGSSTRSSHATNATPSTTAAAKLPRTAASPQPCAGPSMIAHTNVPSDPDDRAAPIRSKRPASGSRELGTSTRPAASAMTTTGALTRNTEPHQKCRRSSPPVTGPMNAAVAFINDQ